MSITPDSIIYWHADVIKINATLVATWGVMALLVVVSILVTRRLSQEPLLSPARNLLEIIVSGIQGQIREITQQDPDRYLPFIGTLFLFISLSNALAIVPGFHPPTGSLSTTAALALCVFVAVPYFGIADRGLWGYLRTYIEPSVFMLPFNVLGELTRTAALAIRLFGNVMSGAMVAATIMAIAPFFFPVFLNALGLLIGLIQAYIFSVLATVFIGSATRAHHDSHAARTTNRQGVFR